ncbi:MAG: hypothetical protein NZ805_09705 [Armatimonadetes bacterium]|nr:hypothetical protein [Armatimonadota bacterium]MDW8029421.1 hypothetical protein [Armatimonadota bacterium]
MTYDEKEISEILTKFAAKDECQNLCHWVKEADGHNRNFEKG